MEKEKGGKADVCIFVDLPGYGFAKVYIIVIIITIIIIIAFNKLLKLY